MAAANVTPMVQQYMAVKQEHQNELLFFRLGDFYEMFFDDAITASRELNLTLTKRSNGMEHMPMCGVPYHSVDGYIAKLIKNSFWRISTIAIWYFYSRRRQRECAWQRPM